MPRPKRIPVPVDSVTYRCSCCSSTGTDVMIKCTECTNVELCLQCFSCGMEIGKHKKQHKYSVINCGNFPIFKPEDSVWTSKHEMQLLCAIQQYGFGNWNEIASCIDNDVSAEDAETHYNDLYINGNIGAVTWKIPQPYSITDHTKLENGPLSPSLTEPVLSEEIPVQQRQELGYMPLRDDFELEFDNDAESLVSDLIFSNEDDELEKSLKLAQIQMYNEHLKKRLLMKKSIRQHNEVHKFFNSAAKPKLSPAKKQCLKQNCKSFQEFQEQMQPYARFYSESELRYFFESLQKEKDLKNRAIELITILKFGPTDVKGCKYSPKKNFNGIKRRRKNKKLKFTWKKRAR